MKKGKTKDTSALSNSQQDALLTVDNAIKEEKPEELSPEIVRSKTNQIEKQLLM